MKTLRTLGWVLCMIAVLPFKGILSADPARAQTADELVARWADALGGTERIKSIENIYVRSKVATSGLEGVVEVWSTSEGAMREDLDFGGLFGSLTVFDGTQGWVLDHNGKLRDIQGAELKDRLTSAYFASFSPLVPGRRPGKIEARGMDSSGQFHLLDITPEGGLTLTYYLNKDTYLPEREARPADDRVQVSYSSDWREVDGFMVPYSVRVTTGDPQYDVFATVEEARLNVRLDGHEFEKPAEGPKDYRITGSPDALNIPFELTSNHIYVQAKVNGKGPLWFILDTGAGVTVLDAARAEALGLEMKGQIEGRGAGEGSTNVSVIPAASFELPGLELINQTIMSIPLKSIEPFEGRAIDGILGYDLISRFVVEIDYAGRMIRLHESEGYNYSGKGERIPIVLEQNHPHVTATVAVKGGKPVQGHFTIDTGARTALHLSMPFCETNRFADATRTIEGGYGAGVGGETKQALGRMAMFQMGGIVLSDVVVGFSQDQRGALASRDSDGLIGGDILRRFTVIFDYSRSEMILEPNAALKDPFEYDMSGAFLMALEPDFEVFRVQRVIPASPAAEAGLDEGDVILSIDGRASSEFSLEEVRRLFLEPGREYTLELQEGDNVRSVKLKTRRLI